MYNMYIYIYVYLYNYYIHTYSHITGCGVCVQGAGLSHVIIWHDRQQVLALFQEMEANELLPNIVTHNVLISARVSSSHWETGPIPVDVIPDIGVEGMTTGTRKKT